MWTNPTGSWARVAGRAQEIHRAACKAARPDPAELGERLAHWALGSDWEAAARVRDDRVLR
jgi:hypothetical protein